MVKIAVAGGSGHVAREIIDVLHETGKHEILILSRDGNPTDPLVGGISWTKVDYEDRAQLVSILRGVHTVLSFIVVQNDPGNAAQKNLIDAAVEAGVKRFAPSEWASSGTAGMSWYSGKEVIREYLKQINQDKKARLGLGNLQMIAKSMAYQTKVLEYTLFQPGLFLNYLSHPQRTSKYLPSIPLYIDYRNCRAILPREPDKVFITLTTVQDLAGVVAKAVEYDGVWPVVSGIQGNKLTLAQLVEFGEKLRGKPFVVEQVNPDETGNFETSWIPELSLPFLKPEEIQTFSKVVLIGILTSTSHGAWVVEDTWNRLLPDYHFTTIEEFVSSKDLVWDS